jgi:hypothetical protein
MSDLDSFGAAIKSPALRAVLAHWNDARRHRKMPSWSDLNPGTMAPHLGLIWAFKYDRGRGEFTARLAGNRIMVGFGKSFRGTPLKALHPPDIFQWVHAGLTRIVSEPTCYRSSGELFRANGVTVEGERVVMPLGADDDGADGAFGASDFDFPVTALVPEIEVARGDGKWLAL